MTRRFVRTIWVIAGLVSTVGCGESPASGGDSSSSSYRTTSTIKDIMDSVIDPSADFVWDSVQVVATLQGTEEHAPKTDDDWKAVRRHAISLVEASNLLIMPGRRIAKPGEKADDPNVDLPPEEIQRLVDADRDAWVRLALGLHDAASQTLAAVDSRDVKALLAAGEVLDEACESCHKKYWYPGLNPGQAAGEPEK
jgi:hypothetical protein